MSKIRFIDLDVHAGTIAVARAEPNGEVRSLGVRMKSIRKLVTKLVPIKHLKACYEVQHADERSARLEQAIENRQSFD